MTSKRTRRQNPAFDLDTFSEQFRKESDRACAVLGAALLDSRLESLYRRRLQGDVSELVSFNGPVGTFSARIRLAHGLSWISDDVRHDLDVVRSIRNDFAHFFDHRLSFEDPSIVHQCETLRVPSVLIEANEYAATAGHRTYSAVAIRAMGAMYRATRHRFEFTVEMLAQHIGQIPDGVAAYPGPDLNEDLWNLAAFGLQRP
jgi:DNA-binding MltR family transcriptional regulator